MPFTAMIEYIGFYLQDGPMSWLLWTRVLNSHLFICVVTPTSRYFLSPPLLYNVGFEASRDKLGQTGDARVHFRLKHVSAAHPLPRITGIGWVCIEV